MDSIKVVIASHNRPDLLIQSVESVLKAIDQFPLKNIIKLEVSENSDNDVCLAVLKKFSDKLVVVKRRPCLSPLKHFETIINEVDSSFFVLFHDDDIMLDNFFVELFGLISSNQDIGAVGGNAYYFQNNQVSKHSFLRNKKSYIVHDSHCSLLNSYFDFTGRIVPFPSYIYRTESLKKVELLKFLNFGKYLDFGLLSEILNYKKILWTDNIVMHYRLHDSNDSGTISIHDYLKLYNSIKNNNSFKDCNETISKVRFYIWHSWILNQKKLRNKLLFKKRKKIILRFIISRFLFYNFTNHHFLIYNLKKFINNLNPAKYFKIR